MKKGLCPYRMPTAGTIVLWSRIFFVREKRTQSSWCMELSTCIQKPVGHQRKNSPAAKPKCLVCRIHVSTTCMSAQKNIVSLSQQTAEANWGVVNVIRKDVRNPICNSGPCLKVWFIPCSSHLRKPRLCSFCISSLVLRPWQLNEYSDEDAD